MLAMAQQQGYEMIPITEYLVGQQKKKKKKKPSLPSIRSQQVQGTAGMQHNYNSRAGAERY